MRKDPLVAFHDEFFNVCGIARVSQLLFAEAAKAAQLPYLVLPKPYLQLFVELLFPIGHRIEPIVHAKPAVGHFVDRKGDPSVKRKAERGTPDHRKHGVVPGGRLKRDIESGNHGHADANDRKIQLHDSPYTSGLP